MGGVVQVKSGQLVTSPWVSCSGIEAFEIRFFNSFLRSEKKNPCDAIFK